MRYITVIETARRLGVTPQHAGRLIKEGSLAALDVSRQGAKRRRYLVELAALQLFLKNRKVLHHVDSGKAD